MTETSTPSACVLLIGDELLTGKVRDENGHFLALALRRRGIRLVEICTVGDRPDEIGDALLRLCARAPLVFTSGGVGPTHDDRTLEAIAAATGRPLQRDAVLEAQLRRHYGEGITDAALRMADLPEGTGLLATPGWPVFRLALDPVRDRRVLRSEASARIYILPGVPSLLRAKFEHLEAEDGELPQSAGWHLEVVYTDLDESHLAAHLDAVVAAHAGVDVGSYPRWSRGGEGRIHMHVRVTLEGPQAIREGIVAARAQLVDSLGAAHVLDHEPPA